MHADTHAHAGWFSVILVKAVSNVFVEGNWTGRRLLALILILASFCFFYCSTPFLSSLPESNITVALSSNFSEVVEGDVIQLTCSVHITAGPLSVVWQWMAKQGNGPVQEVASVDRDGTVSPSPAYRERSNYGEIRVEKVQGNIFSLSLYNALPGDEGQYRCTASEWLQTGTEPELVWEKIGEKSDIKTVTVKTVGKLLQPNLNHCNDSK